MKKHLLLLICLLAFTANYAQSDAQVDSLTMQMCKTLKINENLTDSIRLRSTYEKHFPAFAQKFNITTEEQFNEVFKKVHFRLQRNCVLASQLFANLEPKSKEWAMISAKPKSTVTKKQCRDMSALKKFYYIEPNANTKTYVTVDNGLWYEDFADGTFSKLNFKWVSDCEFEIEFIESNNESRKNLSHKGDIYHYGIFNRKGNDFEIWVADNDGNPVQSFWLHIKK